MDLTTITDIKELKSLAYDQLLLQDQAAQNLRMLQARIQELQNVKETIETPEKA